MISNNGGHLADEGVREIANDSEYWADEGVREPSEGVREPNEGVREPSEGVREPNEGVREPNEGIREPSEGVREPSKGVRKPFDYIMGNPPFLGARIMSAEQKDDLISVFGPKWKNVGNMDYVTGWYKKATVMMQDNPKLRAALVSTNSITQGEQVANLWKPLMAAGVHIDFAWRTFIWDSESSQKAHVHCVIVGFSIGHSDKSRRIFDGDTVTEAKNINGYLIDETYRRYLELFDLDENKTPRELSEGMKVKFNLLLALSHGAEILILDEPTSGLDPFSRDELLEVFEELKEHGVAIFFSTHITSDLEKCADEIIYISHGEIIAAMPKAEFEEQYSQEGESLEDTILRMERGVRNA